MFHNHRILTAIMMTAAFASNALAQHRTTQTNGLTHHPGLTTRPALHSPPASIGHTYNRAGSARPAHTGRTFLTSPAGTDRSLPIDQQTKQRHNGQTRPWTPTGRNSNSPQVNPLAGAGGNSGPS